MYYFSFINCYSNSFYAYSKYCNSYDLLTFCFTLITKKLGHMNIGLNSRQPCHDTERRGNHAMQVE